MKKKAFTLFESTVILVITSVILGTSFYLLNLNKKYQDFETSKLLLGEDLKRAQDLSFKKFEIAINNTTSSVCGVGIKISSNSKRYTMIAYATSSVSGSVDCYQILSSNPEEFNFSNREPSLFVNKNNEFTIDKNNPLITEYELKIDEIKAGTSSFSNFSSTSIMFVHPYGEVLIYKDGNKIDFYEVFNISLKYVDKNATITITKAGQVIVK